MRNARTPTDAGTETPAGRLELYRSGGLQGLRERGTFKVVRCADPFAGEMLHFPTTLHLENWLLSCFDRSSLCSVPAEPLGALHRGRLISSSCSLILATPTGREADLVVREQTQKSAADWGRFQLVAKAHRLQPVLRTRDVIRAEPLRLRSYERMRQALVQGLLQGAVSPDTSVRVAEDLARHRETTIAELSYRVARRGRTPLEVEGAVIRLYRSRAVQLNVGEVEYGQATRVEQL